MNLQHQFNATQSVSDSKTAIDHDYNNLIHYNFVTRQLINPNSIEQTPKSKKSAYETKFERAEKKQNRKIHHSSMMPLAREEVAQIKEYLLNKPVKDKDLREMNINLRNYTWWSLNVNIALRCEDLLNLQIEDFTKNRMILDDFDIIEKKTGKKKAIALSQELKDLLSTYLDSLGDWKGDWFLFHALRPERNPYEPMTTRNVNYILKDVEKKLNLKHPLASHCMRKTPGRILFDMCAEEGNLLGIEIIQDFYNHEKPSTSRLYLGITREDKLNTFKKLASHGMI